MLSTVVQHYYEGKKKVYVIEAYDSNRSNKHGRDSLHYEGRAIDLKLVNANPDEINISNKDDDKVLLRRLATQAYYEARFSFVQVEESHVHVSCRRNEDSKCYY